MFHSMSSSMKEEDGDEPKVEEVDEEAEKANKKKKTKKVKEISHDWEIVQV